MNTSTSRKNKVTKIVKHKDKFNESVSKSPKKIVRKVNVISKAKRKSDNPTVKSKVSSPKELKATKRKQDTKTEDNEKRKRLKTDTKDKKENKKMPSAVLEDAGGDVVVLLSELENLSNETSRNICNLFKDDCTIPFICRYRQESINNMPPERIREIKISYDNILTLHGKMQSIIKQLEAKAVLTKEIKNNILNAKTMEELLEVYEPYKTASKGTLVERARALGLDEPAKEILTTNKFIDLHKFINKSNKNLDNLNKVEEGISNILIHETCKDIEVIEEMKKLQKTTSIFLHSTKAKSTKENENIQNKYQNYFDFKKEVRYLESYQILAINRGHKLKCLSVKVVISDYLKNKLRIFLTNKYLHGSHENVMKKKIMNQVIDQAINKKLTNLMTQQILLELKTKAEKSSINVFSKNLKQLLLLSPIKGKKILGIDPGFTNGCKIALISESGDLLETDVIYPHNINKSFTDGRKLAELLTKYNCTLIALGNGTACRETETWLTQLFKNGTLDSEKICYSIISEQGSSIYSCSKIGEKEFPKLDPKLRSAVSIARRLNDPLCEYIKIEPKHLGIGMYQHDINEKHLTQTLNYVVSECVSFVGVDINTASTNLLSFVAGLTENRAEKIINHRNKNGKFKAREDLLKVATIGPKIFEQCAGFLKIDPNTANCSVKEYNKFDSTWIHPESYTLAEKLIKKANLQKENIGNEKFIEKIKQFNLLNDKEKLSYDFSVPVERIKNILEALEKKLLCDYRDDFNKKPLFKKSLNKITDLCVGIQLTGAITNITDFGCFVDIGVESNGLIHEKELQGKEPLIFDRVEVKVISLDVKTNRIGLRLIEIL